MDFKELENKMFDFIDNLFIDNKTPINSRIKFYNEISSFIENEIEFVFDDIVTDSNNLTSENEELEEQLESVTSDYRNIKDDAIGYLVDIDSKLHSISEYLETSDSDDIEQAKEQIEELNKEVSERINDLEYY